jgi:hypothetical protein
MYILYKFIFKQLNYVNLLLENTVYTCTDNTHYPRSLLEFLHSRNIVCCFDYHQHTLVCCIISFYLQLHMCPFTHANHMFLMIASVYPHN